MDAWTLQRLDRIRPGQRVTAYKGNLPADIQRCKRTNLAGDKGSPAYASLLSTLQAKLDVLAQNGVVIVRKEPLEYNASHEAPQFSYVCEGV